MRSIVTRLGRQRVQIYGALRAPQRTLMPQAGHAVRYYTRQPDRRMLSAATSVTVRPSV
jgi:hypothetical protein